MIVKSCCSLFKFKKHAKFQSLLTQSIRAICYFQVGSIIYLIYLQYKIYTFFPD